jgi:hypothetical protein
MQGAVGTEEINRFMTKVLEKAFDEASKLTENEQDALGEWLLSEIQSEREWDRAFARSQDLLAHLVKEALAEHRRGQTEELDPDKL